MTKPGTDQLIVGLNAGNEIVEVAPGGGPVTKRINVSPSGEIRHPHAHWLSYDGKTAIIAAQRVGKMQSNSVTGLPRFLSPRGAMHAGLAGLMKVSAALESDIRHLAQPCSLLVLPTADGIEDYATMAPRVVAKGRGISYVRYNNATTYVAAVASAAGVSLAWLGDSRVYWIAGDASPGVEVTDGGCRILTRFPKDTPCPPSPPTT